MYIPYIKLANTNDYIVTALFSVVLKILFNHNIQNCKITNFNFSGQLIFWRTVIMTYIQYISTIKHTIEGRMLPKYSKFVIIGNSICFINSTRVELKVEQNRCFLFFLLTDKPVQFLISGCSYGCFSCLYRHV